MRWYSKTVTGAEVMDFLNHLALSGIKSVDIKITSENYGHYYSVFYYSEHEIKNIIPCV